MMSLIEYSPRATAYAVRCEPSAIRDWRRLKLLDSIGRRNGKGHTFTLSDVARLSLAAFLARNGASLREAFEIVLERGPIVDTVAASLRGASNEVKPDYYLSLAIDPDVSFPASITGAPVGRIDFCDDEPIGVLQVNVSKLMRNTIGRLATFEKGAEVL